MTKTLFVMSLAVIAGVAGDLFLSKGMKDLGDVSMVRWKDALPFAFKVMKAPKIWMGTTFLAAFFFLWLTVLSWEELSIALPLQAATFILGPMAAQWVLDEKVPMLRWAGIVLISLGVVLVSMKPSKPQLPGGVQVDIPTHSHAGESAAISSSQVDQEASRGI